MNFFWSGISAAAIAYLINRWIVNRYGLASVIYLVPLTEETLKTFLPLWTDASIFLTHVIFGLIEAVYDYSQKPEKKYLTMLSSVLSHALLGGATVFFYAQTGRIFYGWLISLLLHVFWNAWILRGGHHCK